MSNSLGGNGLDRIAEIIPDVQEALQKYKPSFQYNCTEQDWKDMNDGMTARAIEIFKRVCDEWENNPDEIKRRAKLLRNKK